MAQCAGPRNTSDLLNSKKARLEKTVSELVATVMYFSQHMLGIYNTFGEK